MRPDRMRPSTRVFFFLIFASLITCYSSVQKNNNFLHVSRFVVRIGLFFDGGVLLPSHKKETFNYLPLFNIWQLRIFMIYIMIYRLSYVYDT